MLNFERMINFSINWKVPFLKSNWKTNMIDKKSSTKEIQTANSLKFFDILFSSPLIKQAIKAPRRGTIIKAVNIGKEITL